MGEVEGLFVEESKKVESNIGKEVYFGEILGKHSEVYGTLSKEDLTVVCDDSDFVNKFIEIMGDGTISGYNPIQYIQEDFE